MSSTTIFGFAQEDMGSARAELERVLGVWLQARDSMYVGPYYHGALGNGELIQLRHNEDPLFDEQRDDPQERFSEPDFPEARLLLYVHGMESGRARQLLRDVSGIAFLSERQS
jgi:hypothetical protein